MIKKRIFAIALLAVAGAVLALGAQAPDLAGTWIGHLITNDNQTDPLTLVLKLKDSGYEGTIKDDLGGTPPDTKLRDIVLKDSTLGFVFDVVENGAALIIRMSLAVEGDKMKGSWEDRENGTSGPVELARKK